MSISVSSPLDMSHLESIVPPLFKKTLGQWASGVTVITTLREGKPHGMTASSFSLFPWNLPWSWYRISLPREGQHSFLPGRWLRHANS